MPFILSVELKDLGTCQLRKNSLDCHLSQPYGCGEKMRIGSSCLRMGGGTALGVGYVKTMVGLGLGVCRK